MNQLTADKRVAQKQQTMLGVTLALAIIVAWLAAHISAIFVINWGSAGIIAAVAMIMFQSWLFTGLFIVAHDCMHGSFAPGKPWLNRLFGRATLLLYAAFSFDRLLPEHHKHHKFAGTADDPDFDENHPDEFWPWLWHFLTHYYGWREFAAMSVAMIVYFFAFEPVYWKVVVFYALPAILSALQLFYFGTYLPHRHEEGEFEDRHNSRTNDYPWLVSLFTCFHFGYHHEHHLSPGTPWYRLPTVRAARRRQGMKEAAA
ncbi:MAG: fatty acid desaturase [Pseudomonadota bacterium]